MRTLDRDLEIAAAAALVCAAIVVSVPLTPVRAVFAVPLCLILPGYAFVASAFARACPSWLVQLMMVPAMSLVTLAFAALVLNLVPSGLNEASWAIALVVIVVGECIVARLRRPPSRGRPVPNVRTAAGPTAPVVSGPTVRGLRLRMSPLQALMLLVALLLAAAALVASRIPLAAPNAIGYTQLWMFSTGTPAAPSVKIGVKSAEQHPLAYRLVVSTGSGAPIVVEADMRLRPGKGTVFNIPLFNVPRPESLVIVRLYRLGKHGVYRQVTALVPSTLRVRRSRPGAAAGRGKPRSSRRP